MLMPFSQSHTELTALNTTIHFAPWCFLSLNFLPPLVTAILVQRHGTEMVLLPTCEGDIIIFYDLLFCDIQRVLSDHVTRFIHTG